MIENISELFMSNSEAWESFKIKSGRDPDERLRV